MEAAEILAFVARLNQAPPPSEASAGIDLIGALETMKCVSAALQAVAADAVATEISDERKALGKPKSQWRKGLPSQIGLARRESPNKGSTYLGLARALVHELPHTLERLRTGELNEWRATIITRETASLAVDERRIVDERLCADPQALKNLGDKAIEGRVKALAAEIDPEAAARRKEKAFRERRAAIRPQPDFMCEFKTSTSMDRAVSMWATLKRDADAMVGVGDEARTRDQIMADLAFDRITGAETASAGAPVSVNLVISDETLLGGGGGSAHLQGYGDIPASIARALVREADADGAKVELRKLYAEPTSGALTAMESKSRIFPKALARLIDVRDRTCRTPWCDAPIRHHDHIQSFARGGKTSAHNGAGLCAVCNQAKEAQGWASTPGEKNPAARHIYRIVTPTGHEYSSKAPRMQVFKRCTSVIEHELAFVVEKAA